MIERHIPDVVATGYFSSASFERAAQGKYRTSYRSGSHEELDRYLTEQAPRLREHVAETFPEGVKFERAEWNILAEF